MNRTNRNREDESGNNNGVWTAGAVAAVVAALAGGIYWMSRGSSQQSEVATAHNQNTSQRRQTQERPTARTQTNNSQASSTWGSYLTNFINQLSGETMQTRQPAMRPHAPPNPVITNLNSLLSDIYIRYIQLRPDDFRLHYKVFDRIFLELHRKMKEVDLYYGRYSSTVQFAGSHFDNLRIKKPDEFDMDIVIDLPLNIRENPLSPQASDIVFEPKSAGFISLRMGVQYQNLPMRDGNNWEINKTAYLWRDANNYLQRSNFLDWFKGVVDKALNLSRRDMTCEPIYYVDGVPYVVRKSESGPAVTLIIENASRGFRMDVDLVPALKFPEGRWPIGPNYRQIPDKCRKGYWMVVGKPNKAALSEHERARSWRIALHNQERELMHDSYNLRQTIRLMKKLRDAQCMGKIASYYIKTLFFWEIIDRNDDFWSRNSPATLFKIMVKRFYDALMAGKIAYFWNKNNNLIGNVPKTVLQQYAAKLVPLIKILESEINNNQDYKRVAQFLLTPEEFQEYRMYLNI